MLKEILVRGVALEFVAIAAFIVMIGVFVVLPSLIKKGRSEE